VLRKQLTVGGVYDAIQKNVYSFVTKVRTEVDDLNGSAALDSQAFGRFHYKSGNTRPFTTTLDAELSDRIIGRSRDKSSMRHSHRRIATLKLREPDMMSVPSLTEKRTDQRLLRKDEIC
jgi:hypothetical protein